MSWASTRRNDDTTTTAVTQRWWRLQQSMVPATTSMTTTSDGDGGSNDNNGGGGDSDGGGSTDNNQLNYWKVDSDNVVRIDWMIGGNGWEGWVETYSTWGVFGDIWPKLSRFLWWNSADSKASFTVTKNSICGFWTSTDRIREILVKLYQKSTFFGKKLRR